MKIASLTANLFFNVEKPSINILIETETSKEIRIALRKGQQMKEHKTPFPIVVFVFKGTIDFGVKGVKHTLDAGSLIALEGGVPHDLTASEDSIIRLSLSKKDSVKRVREIESA